MPGIEVRTALTLLQQDDCDRSRGKRLPYIESGLPKLFFATGVGGWNRLLMSADLVSKERSARLQALVLSAECFLRLI